MDARIPPTTFYDYYTNDFDTVLSTLKKFQNFASTRIYHTDKQESMWTNLVFLIGVAGEINGDDPKFDTVRRAIFKRIENDLINDFIDLFLHIETLAGSVGQSGLATGGGDVSNNILFQFPELADFELDKNISQHWLYYLESVQSQPKGKEFKDSLKELSFGVKLIKKRFDTIAVLLGKDLGINDINILPAIEFEKILRVGEIEEHFFDIARTLKESFVDLKVESEILPIILEYMVESPFFNLEEYDWEYIVLYTMMLHLVFYRFDRRSVDSQSFLISNYMLRAVATDVPVRAHLSDALYDTSEIVTYLNMCELFTAQIRLSEEKLPKKQDAPDRLLGQLARSFLSYYEKDGKRNDQLIELYLNEIYGNSQEELIYKKWLSELLSVYVHVRYADLIENNKGGELTPADEAHNEIAALIVDFGIGKEGIDKVVDYFKQEKPKVGLNAFLNALKVALDLTKEISIDECVDLQHKLQEAKLIDHDLIYFNSQTNQFEWNK